MSISVGSVSVDIVPDTRGFASQLKTKLKGITAQITVDADTARLREKLDEATHDRRATINVDADTGAAEAQIDFAARNRTATVNANVRGLSEASRGVSGIAVAIATLGPALVPVVAATVGLAGALGAPLAAAGGGLTVFGLIAGKAILNTNKVAKQIADLKKRADTLVDPKAAAAAAAQAKALEASLTGPQKAFLAAKGVLSEAFATLVKSSGGDIFRPINQGMKLLAAIMPPLAPVIHSVSSALVGMLHELAGSAKGGGIRSFLDFLATASGPTLTTFATVLGNIATGFAGLFKAFAPVAGALSAKLLQLSGSFADFGRNAGSNKGLQSFIAYVQQAGPQVAHVLGDVVGAIVHLGIALAPLGGVVLAGIGLLAKMVSAIPTPILGALVSGIIAIVAAVKIWTIAQGILDAVLAANPIGLVVLALAGLVAGFVYAYKSSETFRDIVKGVFKAVGAAASFMWNNVIKPVFKLWLNMWFTIVGAIVNGAAKAFGWVPGIGSKLKAAAAKFNEFRDSVNRALDGIRTPREIRLNVTTRQSVLISSINKPRVGSFVEGAGATGAIVNRPTVALIGEDGPEALVPLSSTAGNAPLPGGSGVDAEQSTYRAFTRALNDTRTVIMPRENLDALDLLVGAG